jgi:integrase
MATIRKRGPYQWQAIIRKKGYPQQTRTFEEKKEAQAWAATIESQMMRGAWLDHGDADKTTMDECLDRYAIEATPKKKGAKQETHRINVLKRSMLAPCYMANIRSKDVAEYRDARLKEGLAANTIRNELNLLSAVFETCRKEWGMEALRNPVKDVSRPSPGKARDRRLLPGEEERLLEAAQKNRSPWIYPAIVIAIETAMRMGEIMSLEWQHIDLEKHTAHLPKTKNGTARDIPLSERAEGILRDLPRSLNGQVLPIKMSTKTISHTFKSVCKAAEIEGLTFHDLRHEATSRFFERGFDMMTVAAITGHKTLTMLKRYTHLRAEDIAAMMRKA